MRRRGKRAADWHGHGLVLLVEDEEPLRRYAARLLTELGFTVVGAADGAQALDVFRERGAELSLVLLDLTLPGLSGEAVLSEIQQAGVPVVLSSGADSLEVRRRFAGRGVAGFLAKPYGLDQLRTTLRDAVR
jgi:DNA-binding response OmpR family regulator